MMDELLELACFKIGFEEFGLGFLKVDDLNLFSESGTLAATPQPERANQEFDGASIPVIDLCRQSNDKQAVDKNRCIVVLKLGSKAIGCVVDGLGQLQNGTSAALGEFTNLNGRAAIGNGSKIGRIRDRKVILLNFDKLLTN